MFRQRAVDVKLLVLLAGGLACLAATAFATVRGGSSRGVAPTRRDGAPEARSTACAAGVDRSPRDDPSIGDPSIGPANRSELRVSVDTDGRCLQGEDGEGLPRQRLPRTHLEFETCLTERCVRYKPACCSSEQGASGVLSATIRRQRPTLTVSPPDGVAANRPSDRPDAGGPSPRVRGASVPLGPPDGATATDATNSSERHRLS